MRATHGTDSSRRFQTMASPPPGRRTLATSAKTSKGLVR